MNTDSSADLVQLIKAKESDILRLLSTFPAASGDGALELNRSALQNENNEVYLIHQDGAEPLGYIIAADYPRLNQAKEISLHPKEARLDLETLKSLLRLTISILSQDQETEYIILKVRDSLDSLTEAAEAMGFLKEGLFISNQFLQGEFTFYSVYQYKLN